jgi:hypothetical protein
MDEMTAYIEVAHNLLMLLATVVVVGIIIVLDTRE